MKVRPGQFCAPGKLERAVFPQSRRSISAPTYKRRYKPYARQYSWDRVQSEQRGSYTEPPGLDPR